MKHELKKMTGTEAKAILSDILKQLSGIAEDDLTTLELRILYKCLSEPWKVNRRGVEGKILDN